MSKEINTPKELEKFLNMQPEVTRARLHYHESELPFLLYEIRLKFMDRLFMLISDKYRQEKIVKFNTLCGKYIPDGIMWKVIITS